MPFALCVGFVQTQPVLSSKSGISLLFSSRTKVENSLGLNLSAVLIWYQRRTLASLYPGLVQSTTCPWCSSLGTIHSSCFFVIAILLTITHFHWLSFQCFSIQELKTHGNIVFNSFRGPPGWIMWVFWNQTYSTDLIFKLLARRRCWWCAFLLRGATQTWAELGERTDIHQRWGACFIQHPASWTISSAPIAVSLVIGPVRGRGFYSQLDSIRVVQHVPRKYAPALGFHSSNLLQR